MIYPGPRLTMPVRRNGTCEAEGVLEEDHVAEVETALVEASHRIVGPRKQVRVGALIVGSTVPDTPFVKQELPYSSGGPDHRRIELEDGLGVKPESTEGHRWTA